MTAHFYVTRAGQATDSLYRATALAEFSRQSVTLFAPLMVRRDPTGSTPPPSASAAPAPMVQL